MLMSMCFSGTLTGFAQTSSCPKDFELIEQYHFYTGYENNETHGKRSMWYLNRATNVGPVVNNSSSGSGGFYITGNAMGKDGTNAAYVNLPSNTYTHNGTEITINSGYPVLFHHVLRGDHVLSEAYDVLKWSAWVKNTGLNSDGDFTPIYITSNDGKSICEIKSTDVGYKFNQYTTPGEIIGNSCEISISDTFDEFDMSGWHRYGIMYDSVNKQAWYFIDNICVGYTISPESEIVISGQTTAVTSFPGQIDSGGALYAVDDVEVKAYDYRVFNPRINLNLKTPGLVPCENDSVDFNFSILDYEKLIDGKSVYLSLERNGIEIDSLSEFKSDGSLTDSLIKKGENRYILRIKDSTNDTVILSSQELLVNATEIKPNVLLSFRDYQGDSSIEVYTDDDDVVFNYKGEHCEDIINQGDAKLVVYSDGIRYMDIVFVSSSGSFSIPVSQGVHVYYIGLNKADDTEVASSGILGITGKNREYAINIDAPLCSDGALLPPGTKVNLFWHTVDCDKILSETNIEIYNNSDLIYSSSVQRGDCIVDVKSGENKLVAKIFHGNSTLESVPFTIIGIDDTREPNFTIDLNHESNDTDYEQYWYVTLKQNGGVIKKSNDGNEGFYLFKEGVGIDSSKAVYTSLPKAYFDKNSESSNKITGAVTYYHQNRDRARMNVPENDFLVYSVMVKNTGDASNTSFIPLRLMKTVEKNGATSSVSMAEIQAVGSGFKCIQYDKDGNVSKYKDVDFPKDTLWHKYAICYDADAKTVSYFVDDILIASTTDSNSEVNFWGNMCGYTRFPEKYSGASDSVEYVLDNVFMRTYSPLFKTELAISNGEDTIGIADGALNIAYENTKLIIKFSQPMNTNSLNNICLKANGVLVSSDGSYDEITRSFKFNAQLEPFTKYEIDVSKVFTSVGAGAKIPYNLSFTTRKAPLSIESVDYDDGKINVVLNNENNYEGSVLLFAAYYSVDGKTLKLSAKSKISSLADGQNYELSIGEQPTDSLLKVILLRFDNLSYADMLKQ